MMKILLLLVLAIPPWLAVKFGAPKWGLALSTAPFFLLAMSMGDPDDHMFGEASEWIGKWLLLFVGLGGIALGLAAWTLRGTSSLLGLAWWVGPIALIVAIIAVVRILRK
ncbi:hypothetical protein LPB67_14850 [Undibacterium sp. Jales W-56]|uniref:hypothetical protein n=1 Tax=Undibacterium sp. Jales W-56 TaxID=2897325 RepID=UPI0021D3015C|nr:hypothetical protein [Undibacterium sp. Jales W-56]MCU6435054.1 hypothetical protein [Undibacterium sp. Jales W-56]